MTKRPAITAAIIALNEAHQMPDLLRSLDWVDEVVVVDGGSSDGTADLCRQRGCRVLVHPFDGYARQRNRAMDVAQGDWVLSIDADERPTPALVDEICRRIATARYAAYRVPIRSRIFGRKFRFSGTQDDRPVRLFRRDGARWQGDVHEVLRVAGRVGRLEHHLQHETLPDLRAFRQKMHRYTALEAAQRVARGRPPRWRDALLAPPREVFRRLVWKLGALDGPQGWSFCLLSGWSEWSLYRKHVALWRSRKEARPGAIAPVTQTVPTAESPTA